MATQEKIQEAIDAIRPEQGLTGKRGNRQHGESPVERNALRNALEHPCCGRCDHLIPTIYFRNGHDQVGLGCEKGYSPRTMWWGWDPLDAPITCLDCTDPHGRPVAPGDSPV